MPVPESNIKSSAEAASGFVNWYYQAINEGKPVASGYVNNNKTYTAANHPAADICVNGQVISTPEAWDKLLEEQRNPASTASTSITPGITPSTPSTIKRPPVKYHVESYDVHILNADYRFAAPEELVKRYAKGAGVRMMLMLTVSGTVYFGEDKDSLKQHFNDVFTLVPNWEVIARSGSKATRRYIVSSQNYRAY